MTPFEKATQVIATLRPHQVWNHIAKSEKQYLLIGEIDHGDCRIAKAVTRALPALGKGGFAHIGLEREADLMGNAYRAFHVAAKGQKSKTGQGELLDFLCDTENPHVSGNEDRFLDAAIADVRLHTAIRAAGMTPHFIRYLIEPEDYINLHYSPSKALEYNSLLDYRDEYGRLPRGTTARQRQVIAVIDDRLDARNLQADGKRMRLMRKAAGRQRAVIYYGAGHFHRSKTEGMDKHLPANSAVYVQVGESELIKSDLRSSFRWHRGSVPDFVVTTDTKQAWVLPPAIKNGLWHA